MFGKKKRPPEPERRELYSGGWVDLAECQVLWSSRDGEKLWRTPNGKLVMRWAERYATYETAGIAIMAHVYEWRMDEVTRQWARDFLMQRGSEFPTGHAHIAASQLFPEPPKQWDPGEKI